MAIEQDELKLTVALDDQASAGLGNLQKQLQAIIFSIAPAQAGLKQVGQSLRGIGGHANKAHASLFGLARGGLAAGFFFEVGRQVEQMAKSFAEAVLDIKAYADTMVSLDQTSKRAAQSMGQFRANVAVFRESGVGQEQATKMLSGYANALAELQRPGNPIVQQLLRGQVGVARERMESLLQTIMTSSQTQSINAIRNAGRLIREEHERKGRPELGAASEASFYARLGMPGLENVRGVLHEISAEEERMYNDRRKDAERYQTSLEKQSDAWHRTVESIQAIAFELLPIAATGEKGASTFTYFAEGVEALEKAMRNTNSEIDKQRSEAARKQVVTPEGREITAQEGLSEDEKRKQILQRRYNPRRTTTTRPGETLPPDFSDISETGDVKDVTGGAKKTPNKSPGRSALPMPQRRTNFLGGEVNTGGDGGDAGAGKPLDPAILASIPSIGDLLKPDPNAIVAPFNPDDYAGTGWRGLPMSKHVIDLTGDKTSAERAYLEEHTERMGLLTNEINQLNEYLAPELMRMLLAGTGSPDFHNAPQGGAEGESNPIRLPPGSKQPGGGSAAEAALLRPWRAGDPVTGTFKGKPYPFLNPDIGTPLPPRPGEKNPVFSGVTEGKGVASWYGQGPGWGDKPGMDQPGSNALRVPEAYQGISLSDPKTVGQFYYVKDPNTGLTHVRQQTDAGPGVRTQKLVDISVAAAQREGYTQKTFEQMQGRVESGQLKPWEITPTGFGTGRSTAPAPTGKIPTVTTQNISQAGARTDLPSGMDVEFNPFQQSGGPAWSTLDPGGGSFGGGGASADLIRYNPQTGEKEPEQEPRALQRAVEGVRPGSDLEWQLRTERALREAGPGYSETQSAQPPMGYGPGTGLNRPGELGREAEEMERNQRLRDKFNPDEQTRSPSNPTNPGQIGGFDTQTGKPLGTPINFDPSALDGSALDRAAANNVNVNQSGRLRVDVNAPAGTTVSAEGAGVFNQTETNRSVPMEAQA